jgi:glutamyl-tRNA synthetase
VAVVDLLKARANTLIEIAQGAKLFYMTAPIHDKNSEEFGKMVQPAIYPMIHDFVELLQATDGTKESIAAAMKTALTKHSMKMPALAMPIRYLMFATTQTPAIDAMMAIIGKEEVLKRLSVI